MNIWMKNRSILQWQEKSPKHSSEEYGEREKTKYNLMYYRPMVWYNLSRWQRFCRNPISRFIILSPDWELFMWLFYINSQVTLIPTTFSLHGHNIVSVCVTGNDNFIDKISFFFNSFSSFFSWYAPRLVQGLRIILVHICV